MGDIQVIDKQTAIVPAGKAAVEAVVKDLVEDTTALEDLSMDDLELLKKHQKIQAQADELKLRYLQAKVDYEKEKARFLERAGRKSEHTRKAYAAGFSNLEAWATEHDISIVAMGPKECDDYINALVKSGKSANTVRLYTSGPSAFFSFLHRRYKEIDNGFVGTKDRPAKAGKKILGVPNDKEVGILLRESEGAMRCAILTMVELGLRVGALPALHIRGDMFYTVSKGKAIEGPVPPTLRKAIEASGLSLKAPFADYTVERLTDDFRYLVRKLHKAGRLSARFSPHDLRHYAAVKLYKATRDVYAVSRFLYHASVSITEVYLKSLPADFK
jgi:site-specific recombinase XerD